jgi:hypothetical protein
MYTNGYLPNVIKIGLTHTDIQAKLSRLNMEAIDHANFKYQEADAKSVLKKGMHIKNPKIYFAKTLLSAIDEVLFINADMLVELENKAYEESN